MKVKTIVVATLLSLSASTVMAEINTSKEEGRGLLAGTVIGAGIGGPFGAGLGAIFGGGIIGKLVGVSRINNELVVVNNELQGVLKTQIASRRNQDEKLKVEIANLSQELDAMLRIQTASWNSRQLPIQFRTGSSAIEGQYVKQLEEVARILSRNLDTKVSLSGFADRRGDPSYNLKLSENRVAEVQAYLLSHGVRSKQIQSKAFGETRPLSSDDNYENDFFDRRVVMQFSFDIKSYLATR